MVQSSPPKPHHHGNLREALIRAAIDIIQTGGPDALSLRKCAAHAGVSHAAPAHHFDGLISLRGAVIARSHRMFAKMMRDHAARAEETPLAQLQAICIAYVAFARDHAALFKFMFQPHSIGPEMLDATTAEELICETASSYLELRQACAPFQHPSGNNVAIETMVWSLVHGYALLFSDGGGVGPQDEPLPGIIDILPPLALKPEG